MYQLKAFTLHAVQMDARSQLALYATVALELCNGDAIPDGLAKALHKASTSSGGLGKTLKTWENIATVSRKLANKFAVPMQGAVGAFDGAVQQAIDEAKAANLEALAYSAHVGKAQDAAIEEAVSATVEHISKQAGKLGYLLTLDDLVRMCNGKMSAKAQAKADKAAQAEQDKLNAALEKEEKARAKAVGQAPASTPAGIVASGTKEIGVQAPDAKVSTAGIAEPVATPSGDVVHAITYVQRADGSELLQVGESLDARMLEMIAVQLVALLDAEGVTSVFSAMQERTAVIESSKLQAA